MERPEITSVFFDQIRKNGKSILIFNYEGPLTPYAINKNRNLAMLTPAERLDKLISLGCEVIVISGMPPLKTKDLMGLRSPLEIWGASGVELLTTDGTIKTTDVDFNQAEGLHRAKQQAKDFTRPDRITVRSASLEVSWKDLDESEITELRQNLEDAWKGLDTRFNLKSVVFEDGIELVARGFDKGSLVKRILDFHPYYPSCYLGDDFSDEEAFKALWGRGLAVLINRTYRETAAQIWLSPPEELNDFLDEWIWALQNRNSDCRD